MSGTRMHDHLPWMLMTVCCVVFATAQIFGKGAAYRSGVDLEAAGLGFADIMIFPFLLIGFLGALATAPFVTYQVLALRSLSKKYLLTLLSLPASWFISSLIPIPSFEDGLAATLKKGQFLDQLTESAAMELKKPSIENDWERKRGSQLLETHPFSILKKCDPPNVSVLKETLILDFGGSLSRRWGLAISGTPDVQPSIPSYALAPSQLNKEIWIYSAID